MVFFFNSHDGWITPRDNSIGNRQEYTIIKLAHEGTIEGIVIDTKHFIGNAPKSVIVEGCSMVDQVCK
jgi:allantoicase